MPSQSGQARQDDEESLRSAGKNSGLAATEIAQPGKCTRHLLTQETGQESKESASPSDSENGFFPNQVEIR